MFEFFFKYPASVLSRGTFVLLGSWPRWLLYAGLLAAAAVIVGVILARRKTIRPGWPFARSLALGALQWALLAMLLLLLWEPAVSVTTLKPQQNIVAVVVDDSRSMTLADTGTPRQTQAAELLRNKLLRDLQSRFQVRLYRLGAGVERIGNVDQLKSRQPATQIGRGMRELADEAATLPIGSVVLLSDGADNTGGVDANTLAELRRRKLPVNTIGFGRERLENDIELENADVPGKALPGSRIETRITLRQQGFTSRRAALVVQAAGRVVANREIKLSNAPEQTEIVEFNAGKNGVERVDVKVNPLEGESNADNNHLSRVLSIDSTKRRILYVEGEPRWEYKFMRRAADDDPAVQIVSMLRTTQNKIYRQGLRNQNELADGFPTKEEDLFAYDGLILGSVELPFFSGPQQQMMRDFVDRRGGGMLFMAGRSGLSDGGYNTPPMAELLPVNLPTRKNTFQRTFVAAELTEAGKNSPICRIDEDAQRSVEHWEVLPYLANYQDPGTPKPGAVVLANINANGRRVPLLAIENYGRGRTAVLATAGTWRWKMQQPVADNSQPTFWRQLLRWMASSTPTQVTASTPNQNLADDGHLELRAEVRDKKYLAVSDADVNARIIAPDGSSQIVPLKPDATKQGFYKADWEATLPGSYVAELSASRVKEKLGDDVLAFARENGVAENFHREQNRALLEKLADETGGRYYTPKSADKLGEEIAYSDAGISAREMKDLWNMPAIFLLLLALRSAEWLLRRRWGVV
jgi:uncharacterized membrane protein